MKNRKMAAPIAITVLFLVYLAVYGVIVSKAAEWNPLMILVAVPLIALGGGHGVYSEGKNQRNKEWRRR